MVLGGDFRQILPVIPHGSKAQQLSECLKRSSLWKHFTTLRLTKNVRAKPGQAEFCDWLLQLGVEKLPAIDDEIEIPAQCISQGNFCQLISTWHS